MLLGDAGKFGALVAGIAFASFLSCMAACYFAGFMTRSFALVAEQPGDVWVMDRTTASPDQFANLTAGARDRIRSIVGVADVNVLALGNADARMPDGRLQPFEVIGLDDAALTGAPAVNGSPGSQLLRQPDSAIVDAGGSKGKIDTRDRPGPGTDAKGQARILRAGDELFITDHRVQIVGVSHGLPRFPPRALLYMNWSNALRVLPPDRLRNSFLVVRAARGVDPVQLASKIESRTGYRALSRIDFEEETVQWLLATSEDVGDIATMLTIAVAIGFGSTTLILYIFTAENIRQFAVLTALGARPRLLLRMVAAQVAIVALLGTGIGLGACAAVKPIADLVELPYRMMWWAPVGCALLNVFACAGAALISVRPVLRLEPAVVFSP